MSDDFGDVCGNETYERFERFEEEYLEFNRVPDADRLHPDRRLCGYLKVYSLLHPEEQINFVLWAEHDIVHLPVPHELTDDQIVYLLRCGIGYDADTDSLRDLV
jgi:hypothetical protein